MQRRQDERMRNLVEIIQERQRMIGSLNPFASSVFQNMLDSFDEDYDDEDWE